MSSFHGALAEGGLVAARKCERRRSVGIEKAGSGDSKDIYLSRDSMCVMLVEGVLQLLPSTEGCSRIIPIMGTTLTIRNGNGRQPGRYMVREFGRHQARV